MALVECWEAAVADRVSKLDRRPDGSPLLVAIVGIPGSGKTTSCTVLSSLIPGSVVIPMDGYHIAMDALRGMPESADLIYRRGAPETFDPASLHQDLVRIRNGHEPEVLVPGFDHAAGDPSPDEHRFVRGEHSTVIVEGLYMLHRGHGWDGIADLFDLSVFIESDIDVAVERLKIRNRCIPGYTPEEMDIRCDAVDRVNAIIVNQSKESADMVVDGFVHLEA
eukprot:TRINITY_DN15246_c0_g2_i1.p1 TRINITY_DN15246_c0_g2~~TRINITY_DN15246_c0_g2_i1.p1  ORF type:complete len:222 (-),score=50.63 TRINITY_DN15246_c0_g2_i1:360-1025(-)